MASTAHPVPLLNLLVYEKQNPQTGMHKGYGFIEYEEEKCVDDAIESMNGFDFLGRQIRVSRPKGTSGSSEDGASTSASASPAIRSPATVCYPYIMYLYRDCCFSPFFLSLP